MAYSFDDYLKSKEEEENDTTDEKDSGKQSGWLSFDEYVAQRNTQPTEGKKLSLGKIELPQPLKQRIQKQRHQEAERTAAYITAVGDAFGIPKQEQTATVQQGTAFLKDSGILQRSAQQRIAADKVLKTYKDRSNFVGSDGEYDTGAFFGAGFEGKDKTQQQQAISDTLYLIEGYYTPRVTEKKANPLEGEKQSFGLPELTDWEQRARDPEEAQGLWDELQQQLAYVMYSGTYTESEAQSIADRVYKIVGDYQDKVDDEQMQEAMQWAFGDSSEDFMKEWRYQNGYSKYSTDYQTNRKKTTRESVPYRTTEELLSFVSSGGIFEYDSKRGVYTETPDNDKMAAGLYLANKPVTAEEYDKIINRFNMLAQNGKLPQETAAEWIAIRRENGLLGNTDGINAALTYVGTRGAGEVALEGVDTGFELATQQIFGAPAEALDQWMVRASGYLNEGVGGILTLMGFDDAGETLASKGREQQDYTSRNLVEAEQIMYNEQRAYNEALSGVQNKVVRWLEEFIPGLTASAIGMGASAAFGGAVQMGTTSFTGAFGSAANTGSKALNATQLSAAYRAMGYGIKKARLFVMSGNVTLNTYASLSGDERLNEAQMTAYALAAGAAEFISELMFDGNPLLDGEDAGLFTKWVYSLTDDGSFRSISSTWLDLMKNRAFGAMAQKALTSKAMDLLGEGLEEVISSVGMMAVDYAMYGKTDVTWESLANDFASGVMLSMILSGGNELVQRLGPVNSAGDYKKIKFFTEDQQADIEAASKQMAIYVIDYLGGSQKLMQENGFSESQAEKAAGDFQRILQEYDQIKRMDQARQQVGGYQRQSTAAPEGREQTVGAAGETDISAEEVQARVDQAEGRLGDMDAYSLSYEAAVENAEEVAALWQEEHGKAAQEKNREMLIDAAANAVKLAAAAQINLDNALALTRITQEEHESASGKLQQVTDSAEAAIESYKNGVWTELEARTQGTTGADTVPADSANGTQANQTRQAYAPVMENGAVRGKEGEYQNGTETGTQSVRRDGGRNDGVDSGEQAGGLGESGSQRTAQRRAEGNGQQNNEKALRRQRQKERIKRFESLTDTTDAQKIFNSTKYEGDIAVVPEELYTQRMKEAAREVEDELGVKAIYFKGTLIREDESRRMRRTAGFFDPKRNEIWATVGSELFEPEQLVHHEKYHAYVALKQADVMQTIDKIMEQFDVKELEALVQRYVQAYAGVYDNESIEDIYEELLADAYAGMNRFETVKSAVQYQDTVRSQTQRGTDENKRATRDTRGAPEQRFVIEYTKDNKPFVRIEEDILDGVEKDKWVSVVKENLRRKFPNGITVGKNDIKIDGQSRKEMTYSQYTQWLYKNYPQIRADKFRATNNADEILKATTDWVNEGLNHPRNDRIVDFARGKVLIRVGNRDYSADVIAGTRKNGSIILYDIINLQTAYLQNKTGAAKSTNPSPGTARNTATVYEDMVAHGGDNVKQKLSFDDEDYLLAVRAGDMNAAQEMVDEAAKAEGYIPAARYHQTSVRFNTFKTDKPVAAKYDSETPNGIFFKMNDHDIGIGGDVQMKVYLKTEKTLSFKNRTEANQWYCENVDGYEELQEEMKRAIQPINDKIEEMEDEYFAENTTDERIAEMEDEEDRLIEEMEKVENRYRGELRELLNDFFLDGESGYDSIELEYDGHRWVNGKRENVHTVIVFNPEQIKSADPVTYDDDGNIIPISERFNTEKTDIRYSLEDDVAELDEAYRQEMDSEPMPHRTAEDLKREIKETLLRGEETKQTPTATVTLKMPESDEYETETTVTHEYGIGKPFYSRNTTLTPKEAIGYLEAATGMKWQAVPMKKGLWKAEMTTEELDTVFAPKGYSKYVMEMKERGENPVTQKEYAQEMIAKAWRDPGAPSAATVHPEGVRKEDFSASPALEKIGVKIDGSVVDYETTQQIRQAEDARFNIQKTIKSTIRRYGATNKEVAHAKSIAEGVDSYFDVPESCRFYVVSELAGLYMDERMAGNNLVSQRRVAIKTALIDKAIEMFPKDKQIQENPDLFHPTKLLTMNYRTPERNMYKIFGDELGGQIYDYYFAPVQANEAERTRWMQKQFDEVRRFRGKDGKLTKLNKAESAYTHELLDLQSYVEKVDASEKKNEILKAAEKLRRLQGEEKVDKNTRWDLAVEFDLDRAQSEWMMKYAQWLTMKEGKPKSVDEAKCMEAAKKYRELFDNYFDAINDFLVSHGGSPIGKIEGYAPHISLNEKVNLLNQTLEKLGFNDNATKLPAEIAGLTEEFRPDKRWTPFFQKRNGSKTDYDIVEGFERYVTYISDVLYHMDDIQKLRAAESYLRMGMSGSFDTSIEEAIEKSRMPDINDKIDYLISMGRIAEKERGEYTEKEVTEAFSEFIDSLIKEQQSNTRYSDLAQWMQNYTNILAGKQFGGDRGIEHMGGRGWLTLGNRINAVFARANVAGNLSSALNQKAQLSAILSKRRVSSVAQAIGEFTTGRLREFKKQSDYITAKKGVKYVARSVGDMFIEGVFKPVEFVDSMMSTLAVRSAYLDGIKNGMTETEAMRFADNFGRKIMADRSKGSKPNAFHSKGFVRQMLHAFQLESLNSWENISQDLPRDFRQIARDGGKAKAARALALTLLKYLIAAFVLNRWSEEVYGGTPAPFDLFGMTSNFIASGNGLTTNEWIKRTINKVTGVDIFEESSYEAFDEFDWGAAVEDTTWNLSNEIPFVSNISGMLGLGDRTLPTALPGIVDAVTGIYDAASENGVFSDDTALALVELMKSTIPGGRQIGKTIGGIRAAIEGGKMNGTGENERLQYVTDESVLGILQQVLFGVNATEESKAHYASGENGLTARQTQMWKEITEQDGDGTELFELIQGHRRIGNDDTLTSAERSEQQRNAIAGSSFTDEQKAYIYSVLVGDKDGTAQDEPFEELMDAGMSWNAITGMFNEYKRIYNDDSIGASEQTTEFQYWIDKQKYTKKQREIINDSFRYGRYSSVDPKESNYSKLVEQGVSPEDAKRIVESTEARDGESVKMKDKIDAILAQNMSDDKTYTALGAVLNEGVYDKLTEARAAGISCRTFLNFREEEGKLEADVDPNDPEKKIPGSKKEKIVELIDGLQLTAEQKDVLYLMYYAESGLYDTPWH